jgi:hypothetical protein
VTISFVCAEALPAIRVAPATCSMSYVRISG